MSGGGVPIPQSPGSLTAAEILSRIIGTTTLAAGALIFGDGDSQLSTLTIGAANTVLTSSGTAPQWSTSLALTSTIASKQASAAGISLDHNSATGNFTHRLSPENLTANRRTILPDADLTITGGGTFALGGFTFTVPATGTAALLGVANTFTALNTFNALIAVAGNGINTFTRNNASNAPPSIYSRKSRGTAGSEADVLANDYVYENLGQAWVNGAYRNVVDITGQASSVAGSAAGGLLTFWTSTAAGTLTARMTISETGDVAITSATDSTSTITGSLQTAGGLGVAKAAFIGTTLCVNTTLTASMGQLQVLGTTSTFSAALASKNPQFTIYGGNANNRLSLGMDNSGGTSVAYIQSWNSVSPAAQFLALQPSGGEICVGTTTAPTAGNGLLQLATGTTKAAGIAFGDLNLYRAGSTQLRFEPGNTAVFEIFSASNVTNSLKFYTSSTLRGQIDCDNVSMRLVNGGATVLTAPAAGTGITINVTTDLTPASGDAIFRLNSGATQSQITQTASDFVVGTITNNGLSLRTNSTQALYITNAQVAQFADNIELASGKVLKVNTVQVVSARDTGWTAQTATGSKADLGGSPTTAAIASFCRSLYDALATHGLIGT